MTKSVKDLVPSQEGTMVKFSGSRTRPMLESSKEDEHGLENRREREDINLESRGSVNHAAEYDKRMRQAAKAARKRA